MLKVLAKYFENSKIESIESLAKISIIRKTAIKTINAYFAFNQSTSLTDFALFNNGMINCFCDSSTFYSEVWLELLEYFESLA